MLMKLLESLEKKFLIIKIWAVLSKKLARIILDVPIDYNLNDFELSKPDNTAVFEVFDELEFRRIKETFYKIFGLEKSEKNDPKKEYIQGDLFGNNVVDDAKLNLNKSQIILSKN